MLGSTASKRGDVIRCTVMFEEKQEVDGKIQVPVVFSVNGSRIVPEDNNPSFIEYSEERALFPYVAFGNADSNVLAKVQIFLAFFVYFIFNFLGNTIWPKSRTFYCEKVVGSSAAR